MASMNEITQAIVAIGSMIGTFTLIGLGKLDASQGISIVLGLLAGLGIGYANGKKSH